MKTAPEMGWAGIKNGNLLRLAEKEFDIFLTVDRNLEFQQNVTMLDLSIIVLLATSNDIDVLRPLIPHVREVLPQVEKGTVTRIGTL